MFLWDIEAQKIDPKAFEGVSAIIHLAGVELVIVVGQGAINNKSMIAVSRVLGY